MQLQSITGVFSPDQERSVLHYVVELKSKLLDHNKLSPSYNSIVLQLLASYMMRTEKEILEGNELKTLPIAQRDIQLILVLGEFLDALDTEETA